MATRTAPTVNGSPNLMRVAIKLVDTAGDLRTVTLNVDTSLGTPSDADIEAYVAALQAITNTSAYAVEVVQGYVSAFQASNATDAVYRSADQLIGVNFGDATGRYQQGQIRAPLASLFVGSSEEVDTTNVPLGTFLTTALDVINGGSLAGTGTYTAKTVRFTERREINNSQPV